MRESKLINAFLFLVIHWYPWHDPKRYMYIIKWLINTFRHGSYILDNQEVDCSTALWRTDGGPYIGCPRCRIKMPKTQSKQGLPSVSIDTIACAGHSVEPTYGQIKPTPTLFTPKNCDKNTIRCTAFDKIYECVRLSWMINYFHHRFING